MFKQFSFFLTVLAVYAFAAPVNSAAEEQAKAELKAAGMTQTSIDGLFALNEKFAAGFPLIQSNKEATDKFVADFRADSDNFIKSMPQNDQEVHTAFLKKNGLA